MKKIILMATTALVMLVICNSVFADSQKLIEGNNVNLVGKLVIAEDEGNEGMVKYRAIQLNQPVIVQHEDGETAVTTVTLWFTDKKQEAVFKKLMGKKVQAVGTLHYYWHGPSAMPNPAKLEVINIYQ
ncbi:MAG: hypothetical protein Q7W05_08105 [Deltaproteobacteria bacterium]|nr:hypothetical protein [Deltaproteobacteria bacterium]